MSRPKLDVHTPVHDVVLPSGTTQVVFGADLYNFSLGFSVPEGVNPCGAVAVPGGRGGGQHIFVAIDKGNMFLIDSATSIIPTGVLNDGPHLLRSFLVFADEGLKDAAVQPNDASGDFFSIRNFYVGSNNGATAIDTDKPLLTLLGPFDSRYYVHPFDEVLLDFDVRYGVLSDEGYKVKVELYKGNGNVPILEDTLTQKSYCITGLDEPSLNTTQEYRIHLTLVDAAGDPVVNGPGNLNDIEQTFAVE